MTDTDFKANDFYDFIIGICGENKEQRVASPPGEAPEAHTIVGSSIQQLSSYHSSSLSGDFGKILRPYQLCIILIAHNLVLNCYIGTRSVNGSELRIKAVMVHATSNIHRTWIKRS